LRQTSEPARVTNGQRLIQAVNVPLLFQRPFGHERIIPERRQCIATRCRKERERQHRDDEQNENALKRS
jgi:hypothetical protein